MINVDKKYECFCDVSYYDLWAVRPTDEKRWGYCYHLNSKEEAEGLVKELNFLLDIIRAGIEESNKHA